MNAFQMAEGVLVLTHVETLKEATNAAAPVDFTLILTERHAVQEIVVPQASHIVLLLFMQTI